MIDTLILRLHDTIKYEAVIKNLDNLDTKGYSTETGRIEKGEVAQLRAQGYKKSTEIVDMLKLHRTGEFLIKSKVAKQMNASNHYSFAYFVNYTGNFIEFNFSIPKYTFGSNVLLFVDHIGDRDYTYHFGHQIEHNIERSFTLLERFLSQFFRLEFPLSTIDYKDVEVHRIDVCFNQVFSTKKEALRYLEYQKRVKKKYTRDEEGVVREWTTSLMYVTQRYSAKIYHKGAEYERNDSEEHKRLNKERNRQLFKVEEYQKFADRILRYELTIRTGMLNYLHKKHIFRRTCPIYQMRLKVYNKVENDLQRDERISKAIGKLPEGEKEAYAKEHPYSKISKDDRKIHKYVQKLITQRTHFLLEAHPVALDYNKATVNYECNIAPFSKKLLKLCLGKLMEFVDDFQVRELPREDHVKKQIENYNKDHKANLPVDDMTWFYKKLSEIGSFKETARFYHLSRATLYRYKERFRKVGITENNLIPLTEEGIPQAPIDLSAYHYELTFNPNFLRVNNLLTL